MNYFEREILITKVIDSLSKDASQSMRFQSAFAHDLLPSAIVHLDGRWVEVNEALCEMTGYPKEELTKKTWQDITHPDYLDIDAQLVQECIDGKRDGYKLKKKYIRKDGTEVLGYLFVSFVDDGEERFFVSKVVYLGLLLQDAPCKIGSH